MRNQPLQKVIALLLTILMLIPVGSMSSLAEAVTSPQQAPAQQTPPLGLPPLGGGLSPLGGELPPLGGELPSAEQLPPETKNAAGAEGETPEDEKEQGSETEKKPSFSFTKKSLTAKRGTTVKITVKCANQDLLDEGGQEVTVTYTVGGGKQAKKLTFKPTGDATQTIEIVIPEGLEQEKIDVLLVNAGGKTLSRASIKVTAAEPEATVAPTATPEPTAAPTATPEPTAAPTATPEPTAAPTTAPETPAAPTTAPETPVTPTAAPETPAAPTAAPETPVTPTATPEPTTVPGTSSMDGTFQSGAGEEPADNTNNNGPSEFPDASNAVVLISPENQSPNGVSRQASPIGAQAFLFAQPAYMGTCGTSVRVAVRCTDMGLLPQGEGTNGVVVYVKWTDPVTSAARNEAVRFTQGQADTQYVDVFAAVDEKTATSVNVPLTLHVGSVGAPATGNATLTLNPPIAKTPIVAFATTSQQVSASSASFTVTLRRSTLDTGAFSVPYTYRILNRDGTGAGSFAMSGNWMEEQQTVLMTGFQVGDMVEYTLNSNNAYTLNNDYQRFTITVIANGEETVSFAQNGKTVDAAATTIDLTLIRSDFAKGSSQSIDFRYYIVGQNPQFGKCTFPAGSEIEKTIQAQLPAGLIDGDKVIYELYAGKGSTFKLGAFPTCTVVVSGTSKPIISFGAAQQEQYAGNATTLQLSMHNDTPNDTPVTVNYGREVNGTLDSAFLGKLQFTNRLEDETKQVTISDPLYPAGTTVKYRLIPKSDYLLGNVDTQTIQVIANPSVLPPVFTFAKISSEVERGNQATLTVHCENQANVAGTRNLQIKYVDASNLTKFVNMNYTKDSGADQTAQIPTVMTDIRTSIPFQLVDAANPNTVLATHTVYFKQSALPGGNPGQGAGSLAFSFVYDTYTGTRGSSAKIAVKCNNTMLLPQGEENPGNVNGIVVYVVWADPTGVTRYEAVRFTQGKPDTQYVEIFANTNPGELSDTNIPMTLRVGSTAAAISSQATLVLKSPAESKPVVEFAKTSQQVAVNNVSFSVKIRRSMLDAGTLQVPYTYKLLNRDGNGSGTFVMDTTRMEQMHTIRLTGFKTGDIVEYTLRPGNAYALNPGFEKYTVTIIANGEEVVSFAQGSKSARPADSTVDLSLVRSDYAKMNTQTVYYRYYVERIGTEQYGQCQFQEGEDIQKTITAQLPMGLQAGDKVVYALYASEGNAFKLGTFPTCTVVITDQNKPTVSFDVANKEQFVGDMLSLRVSMHNNAPDGRPITVQFNREVNGVLDPNYVGTVQFNNGLQDETKLVAVNNTSYPVGTVLKYNLLQPDAYLLGSVVSQTVKVILDPNPKPPLFAFTETSSEVTRGMYATLTVHCENQKNIVDVRYLQVKYVDASNKEQFVALAFTKDSLADQTVRIPTLLTDKRDNMQFQLFEGENTSAPLSTHTVYFPGVLPTVSFTQGLDANISQGSPITVNLTRTPESTSNLTVNYSYEVLGRQLSGWSRWTLKPMAQNSFTIDSSMYGFQTGDKVIFRLQLPSANASAAANYQLGAVTSFTITIGEAASFRIQNAEYKAKKGEAVRVSVVCVNPSALSAAGKTMYLHWTDNDGAHVQSFTFKGTATNNGGNWNGGWGTGNTQLPGTGYLKDPYERFLELQQEFANSGWSLNGAINGTSNIPGTSGNTGIPGASSSASVSGSTATVTIPTTYASKDEIPLKLSASDNPNYGGVSISTIRLNATMVQLYIAGSKTSVEEGLTYPLALSCSPITNSSLTLRYQLIINGSTQSAIRTVTIDKVDMASKTVEIPLPGLMVGTSVVLKLLDGENDTYRANNAQVSFIISEPTFDSTVFGFVEQEKYVPYDGTTDPQMVPMTIRCNRTAYIPSGGWTVVVEKLDRAGKTIASLPLTFVQNGAVNQTVNVPVAVADGTPITLKLSVQKTGSSGNYLELVDSARINMRAQTPTLAFAMAQQSVGQNDLIELRFNNTGSRDITLNLSEKVDGMSPINQQVTLRAGRNAVEVSSRAYLPGTRVVYTLQKSLNGEYLTDNTNPNYQHVVTIVQQGMTPMYSMTRIADQMYGKGDTMSVTVNCTNAASIPTAGRTVRITWKNLGNQTQTAYGVMTQTGTATLQVPTTLDVADVLALNLYVGTESTAPADIMNVRLKTPNMTLSMVNPSQSAMRGSRVSLKVNLGAYTNKLIRLYYSYAVVNAENPGLNYTANAFASMYADATEKTVELEAHHLPQGSTVTYTLLSSSDGSYTLGGNTTTVVTIGAPYTFAFEKKAYMGSMGQEVSMNLTCAQYNNLPATGVALEVWLMDGNGKKSLLKTVQYTRTPVNTVKIAMPYDQSSAQRIQIGLYLDGTLTDTTQVDLGTPTVAIGFASGQMSAHMQDGYIYLKLACTPGVTQGYSRNLLVSGYYTVGTGGGTSGGGWDGGWNWGWNWGNNNATSSGSTNISDRIAFASMVDGKSTEVIKIPIGAFKANDRITFTLDASLNGSYVLGNVRACTVSIVAPPTFGLARKDVTVSEGETSIPLQITCTNGSGITSVGQTLTLYVDGVHRGTVTYLPASGNQFATNVILLQPVVKGQSYTILLKDPTGTVTIAQMNATGVAKGTGNAGTGTGGSNTGGNGGWWNNWFGW